MDSRQLSTGYLRATRIDRDSDSNSIESKHDSDSYEEAEKNMDSAVFEKELEDVVERAANLILDYPHLGQRLLQNKVERTIEELRNNPSLWCSEDLPPCSDELISMQEPCNYCVPFVQESGRRMLSTNDTFSCLHGMDGGNLMITQYMMVKQTVGPPMLIITLIFLYLMSRLGNRGPARTSMCSMLCTLSCIPCTIMYKIVHMVFKQLICAPITTANAIGSCVLNTLRCITRPCRGSNQTEETQHEVVIQEGSDSDDDLDAQQVPREVLLGSDILPDSDVESQRDNTATRIGPKSKDNSAKQGDVVQL